MLVLRRFFRCRSVVLQPATLQVIPVLDERLDLAFLTVPDHQLPAKRRCDQLVLPVRVEATGDHLRVMVECFEESLTAENVPNLDRLIP